MSTQYIVEYRYYDYDDGHQYWTDEVASFDSRSAAQDFIAELDQRIADGDHDVTAGRITTDAEFRSRPRGRRSAHL